MNTMEPTLHEVDLAAKEGDLSPWVDRFRASRSEAVIERIGEHARSAIDTALDVDIDDGEAAWLAGRIARSWLECLETVTGPALDAFLLETFQRRDILALTEPFLGFNLTDFLGYLMASGTANVREALLADLPSLPTGYSMYAFLALRSTVSPAEAFDRCSPLLEWSRSILETDDDETKLRGIGWGDAISYGLGLNALEYVGERLFPPPAGGTPPKLPPSDSRWGRD